MENVLMRKFRFDRLPGRSEGRLRVILIVALLISPHGLCLSQILSNPVFSFEKLSWGDSLSSVKKHLTGKTLKEQDPKEQFGAASAAMPPSIVVSYEDSLFNNPFRIVLWFSREEKTLNSVIIAAILAKSGANKGTTNEDEILTDVWDRFSNHLGSTHVDGSIPLVGKTRIWSFKGTDVLMSFMNGFGRRSLTVTYSPNRKQ